MTAVPPSALPTTSHWGAYRAVTTEHGVRTYPHPGDPSPSPLLGNVSGALRHPTRVRRPCVRRGWLEDGPGPSGARGREPFVEVEWDEALDLVAAELDRVRDTHGPAAVFGGSYGWASAGRFHHAQSQLHRFLSQFGGYTASRNSYSLGASLVVLPHLVGRAGADAVLRAASSWPTIAARTELLVAFGGVPAKNVHVTPGGVTRHRTPDALAALAEAGTRVALVSPLRDDLPERIAADWYPVRPATDTALMLGLAHTLLREGLHDRAFLDRYTTGFDTFARYLEGRTDGTAKDADWAAALCGIDAADIRRLARRMAGSRTLITVTWSLQRTQHGEQPVHAGLALAAMLGQIGLPGGGFGHGYGSMGDVGDHGPQLRLPHLPQGANPVREFIPCARIADLLLHPGESYDYDGERRTYPDIRLVHWAGGNPFHHHQDLGRLRRAFARPDTIVVHEPHWTATARHADIVLPTTTTLEREDFGGGRRDTHLIAMHRIVEPVGEARDDHRILAELAGRLGFAQRFTEGRTPREWLTHLYDSWSADLRAHGHEVPDFGTFWKDGEYELPAGREHFTLFEDYRRDPVAHPLDTPSGRIEITSARLASLALADCPAHPTWLEPDAWHRAPEAASHPMLLIAHQPATRLHSQYDVGDVSLAGKTAGRETVRLNPTDATARGVRDGDLVRLHNDRGAVLAGARLDTAVRAGVACLPTGAWFDPAPGDGPPLCVHGNPNTLTADIPSSRLSQGATGQHTLVQAERYEGEPPPVTVREPPPLIGSATVPRHLHRSTTPTPEPRAPRTDRPPQPTHAPPAPEPRETP
ncbi:Dimethyl sulfoxide/trimethylamine N-oxide reductase precursor [Streptomyces sp. YIM 130001]|uniref:molybdopterin-dependent oxidoreductase n=1 Tax=Streptomyces sp. YIM 130001 TaxID=2259644 RepID=UPI000E65654F|nr:molybdopterin-dependent oxidoreductase [Streptomyces sp. YIM 130001]RII14680.1 Dimethyl sulfoxide/trimethylamine N-oxide reductase precursor [Streptomyces sp. YIM 130001]